MASDVFMDPVEGCRFRNTHTGETGTINNRFSEKYIWLTYDIAEPTDRETYELIVPIENFAKGWYEPLVDEEPNVMEVDQQR